MRFTHQVMGYNKYGSVFIRFYHMLNPILPCLKGLFMLKLIAERGAC
jgi:hypothetical protein